MEIFQKLFEYVKKLLQMVESLFSSQIKRYICFLFCLVVPNAAEPYLTIARIYEDQNDHNKAFEVKKKQKFSSKSN